MASPGVRADFSVGAVVQLTGISEHVLRAWERRHGAIVPKRSGGGTRRYSPDDVARLRLLAAANEGGHPIRELAPLTNAELARLAAKPDPAQQPRLDLLFAALARLDVVAVERQLGLLLAALGMGPFLETIAAPFMHDIGLRWERGELRPSEEHLASAALHGVLARAQRGVSAASASCIVLATPAGERHELGILMASLCAQERGVRVVHLGCDLPADEIADAAVRVGARAVGLGLVALEPSAARREIRTLRRKLPRAVELWLGGAGTARLTRRPQGTVALANLAELDTRLALIREPLGRDRA